jgi:hypothetical protein
MDVDGNQSLYLGSLQRGFDRLQAELCKFLEHLFDFLLLRLHGTLVLFLTLLERFSDLQGPDELNTHQTDL